MIIEEAVEWLEIIKEGYEYGDIDSAVTIKGYKRCVEAIEKLLNELDKKDKVIDMMAEDITEYEKDIKYYVPEHEEFFKNKEEVKEYYYKKAEEK